MKDNKINFRIKKMLRFKLKCPLYFMDSLKKALDSSLENDNFKSQGFEITTPPPLQSPLITHGFGSIHKKMFTCSCCTQIKSKREFITNDRYTLVCYSCQMKYNIEEHAGYINSTHYDSVGVVRKSRPKPSYDMHKILVDQFGRRKLCCLSADV